MCGIAGILAFKRNPEPQKTTDIGALFETAQKIQTRCYHDSVDSQGALGKDYLGGEKTIAALLAAVRSLKGNESFFTIYTNPQTRSDIAELAAFVLQIIEQEQRLLVEKMGHLSTADVNMMSGRIENLKDIAWCLKREILANIEKVSQLAGPGSVSFQPTTINIFKQINTVLNSIDRLEVRGRDSAGISLMFILGRTSYKDFRQILQKKKLHKIFQKRTQQEVLTNNGISLNSLFKGKENATITLSFTYKVAAEIGRLGDNISFLRRQIQKDPLLQILTTLPHIHFTVSAHTRWASVGAITEANCHPVDNKTCGNQSLTNGIIHACLNGDIDNYLKLKADYETSGNSVHEDITTDTKLIPLQIEKYIQHGFEMQEAFRLAVNDFEGSHAIAVHTDLAPGKIFLAQRGSGQALFVGISDDHYMPSSEIYGLVEETPHYIKLDGDNGNEGRSGNSGGQIVILNQATAGGLDGIKSFYYDGTALKFEEKHIKTTRITTRDIDRQEFPHYFLKEISEAPDSVEKTLQNRWKIIDDAKKRYQIRLDEHTVPKSVAAALLAPDDNLQKIGRIIFVGQGTAGVAAQACADIVAYYLADPGLQISALKSSELSGFKISEDGATGGMQDSLVVAISQSGTTTDTNRTVDMVKEKGAHTLAIVNRRDSDLTFKVDGVIYTSSGRDIEMSVASTKAFYSQIVAGALLGLYLAELLGRRDAHFVAHEIQQLLALPDQMRHILSMQKQIKKSATRLAVGKTYWAAVGSGPNKASADEIRIKLSELCYKTISSDFVEDKKHIDLSAEPLIIVCAAGTKGTVLGDIVKDTAIFHAHKATPVVITDEDESRFDPYAADVFHVPHVAQHLAPIVNTLVGHIWGYYAALAINEGSRFLYRFLKDIQKLIDKYAQKGLDIFEIILEKSFREKIVSFYNEFRKQKAQNRFSATLGVEAASDLTLLLKYLAGKLPVSDFELDFGIKGTPLNMLDALFECMGQSINQMARPIDAIKHQAKTVTVGTSRISEKLEGIFFDALAVNQFNSAQIINRNILVLKNLQNIIARIDGTTLYRIEGLNLLGEPSEESAIKVITKKGASEGIPSRVEQDNRLKGTKKTIVQHGNVYIGKGRKDGRSILVIPIISSSPAAPNLIEYLLLFQVSFKTDIPLPVKIKALGGKFEHIKNIVQENSVGWDDTYLDRVETEELFGRSAEKIGEFIVSSL